MKVGSRYKLSGHLNGYLLVIRLIKEGGEAVIYEVEVGGQSFALKVFKRPPSSAQLQNYRRLAAITPPHPAFVFHTDVVQLPDGTALLMPLIGSDFHEVSQLPYLPPEQRPSITNTLRAAVECCLALRLLHHAGLLYIDFSSNQLLISPHGKLMICDVGNIIVEATADFNLGTKGYNDPALANGLTLPTVATGRFSLAVVLFEWLCCGHPFIGINLPRFATPEDEDNALHRHLAFIFGDDSSNAADPHEHSEVIAYWNMLTAKLQRLFKRSFGEAIHNPALRVIECEWMDALLDMLAGAFPCPFCSAELFHDPSKLSTQCWNCGEHLRRPARLIFRNSRTVVLRHNVQVSEYDISGRECYDFTPQAEVLAPAGSKSVELRNLSSRTWSWRQVGGPEQIARPGDCVPLYCNTVVTFLPGLTAVVAA